MLGQTGTKAYISEETTGIIAKVKTDGTNNALVVTQNSQPLPAGGATSDNQTNGDQKAQIIHADGSALAINDDGSINTVSSSVDLVNNPSTVWEITRPDGQPDSETITLSNGDVYKRTFTYNASGMMTARSEWVSV